MSSPRKLKVTSRSLTKFSLNSGYCFNMCSTSSREIVRSSQYVNARMLALEFTTGLLGSIAKFSPNESPLPGKRNSKTKLTRKHGKKSWPFSLQCLLLFVWLRPILLLTDVSTSPGGQSMQTSFELRSGVKHTSRGGGVSAVCAGGQKRAEGGGGGGAFLIVVLTKTTISFHEFSNSLTQKHLDTQLISQDFGDRISSFSL